MDIEKSIRENQLGAKLHVGKVLGGVDTIEKSVVEDIQKSKPAVAGEIREWSGKKFKKQGNGKWVEVSDSHEISKKDHEYQSKERLEESKKPSMHTALKEDESKWHKEQAEKLSDKEYDEEELGGDREYQYNRIEAESIISDLNKKIKKLKEKEGSFPHRGAWNNFYESNIKPLQEKVIKISEDINSGKLNK